MLGPLFRQWDDVSRAVEAARVAVLSEAIGRGETTSTLARAHAGWIIEWAPSWRVGRAGALLAVTLASRQERHALLREAVLSWRVPVRNAAVSLGEMERIRHRLTPEAVPSVWEGLLGLGAQDGPRAIRALRPALLAAFGCPGGFDGDQERVTALVSLSRAMGGGDGLFDDALRLDTEGMAVLEAALVELVRRAVGAPQGAPTANKSTLFVTVSWEDLVAQLRAGAVVGSK